MTDGLAADRPMSAAAALLAEGGLVAFPTETVYGLGADARSDLRSHGSLQPRGVPASTR